MIYILSLVQFGASNGNKRNQQRIGKGIRKALETQVAQRLVVRDKQHKSKDARREMLLNVNKLLQMVILLTLLT